MYNFSAIEDFYRAHRKASLKEIVSTLAGLHSDLLQYDEILQKLHARGQSDKGLQEIPLDAIVGTVGRYSDFTKDFLPKRAENKDRWVNVKTAMSGMRGVPAIEVYRVGEAYFVKDGHHRVSVARQMGHKFIQAYVTEIRTLVPLNITDNPYDLIIKSEYADFLEKTGFHKIFPDADIGVTLPGRYGKLLEHIEAHRYFMGLDQKRFIPCSEAVEHWYKHVYLPIEDAIKDQGILRDFPGRKSADLYLWIMKYRIDLEKELGWKVKDRFLVSFFEERFRKKPKQILERVLFYIRSVFSCRNQKEADSTTGLERDQAETKKQNLFENILVALNDSPASWKTLEQAILIAKRENGEIYGLHVVGQGAQTQTELDEISEKFDHLCNQHNVKGTLAFEPGSIAERILERSYWVDLVVLNLAHPPQTQALAKLSSGFHTIISHLGRPLLAVPGEMVVSMENCLVAYDGSPKSKEALYVAAYLATGWGAHLTVLHVEEGKRRTKAVNNEAKKYLEAHKIKADFIVRKGEPAEVILSEADNLKSCLILMGSYGYTQMLEVFLGSTLDRILLEERFPVLICR